MSPLAMRGTYARCGSLAVNCFTRNQFREFLRKYFLKDIADSDANTRAMKKPHVMVGLWTKKATANSKPQAMAGKPEAWSIEAGCDEIALIPPPRSMLPPRH